MPDLTDVEKARMTARLNELGVTGVRDLVGIGGLPHTWNAGVMEWLREQDKAEKKPKTGP